MQRTRPCRSGSQTPLKPTLHVGLNVQGLVDTHEVAGSRQGFGIEHTPSASLFSTDAFFIPLFSLIGCVEVTHCMTKYTGRLQRQKLREFSALRVCYRLYSVDLSVDSISLYRRTPLYGG
jgi:hypothetical protein